MATYPVTNPDGVTVNIEANSPEEAFRKAYTQDQMAARQAKGEPNLGDMLRNREYGNAASRVVQMFMQNAAEVPGRTLENLKSAATTAVEGPSMKTALPLSIGLMPGGPAPAPGVMPRSVPVGKPGVLLPAAARLGTRATGAVIDEPKPTLAENYKTAFQSVAGDLKDPISVLTSPLAVEAVGVGSSLLGRGLGAQRIQQRYVRQAGQSLEDATHGVLRAPQTTADWDALVYGAQDPAGNLTSGRATLGDFYGARVAEAQRIMDARSPVGRPPGVTISVPTISDRPIPLADAVRETGRIAAEQSGKNPIARTAQGAATRELRQQAWREIESEVNRFDPSGRAWDALREARNTFYLGNNYLEAVEESGALRSRPNEVGFDSSRLQNYVNKNRAKFIEAFAADGNPAGYREFENMVWQGGPPGTKDILSGATGHGDALRQLYRSGGGFGTTVMATPRTLLPGLGNQYTGNAPYTFPGGHPAMTLSDILAPKFGVDLRRGEPQ